MAKKKGTPKQKDTSVKSANKRDYDPWHAFTSLAKTGASLPLLFTPQLMGFLGHDLTSIIAGKSPIKPEESDERFSDNAWQQNPVYKASMQAYLVWCDNLTNMINEAEIDQTSKEQAQHAIEAMTHTLSPSYSVQNITAMRHALETRGVTLAQGLRRMTEDMIKFSNISDQESPTSLKPGQSIATTEGAVIFRSEVFELIQYQAKTDKVWQRPLLVITSPINKYYLSDLKPDNSLTQYLINEGHQVFTISWRNPDVEHKQWDLSTYVDALIEAVDVACAISKSKDINLLGIAAGGIFTTLLSSVLEQTRKKSPIHSATYAITSFDTQTESQIGIKVNPQINMAARTLSNISGAIDGKDLAQLYAWLKPNLLQWNACTCNYFAAEKLPPEDVLHWNSDSSRISAGLHSDFFDLYCENVLLQPKQLRVNEEAIDLSKLNYDSYFIAGAKDHISSWQESYKSSQILGGKQEFVLVNRGHSRTFICPESSIDARFFTHPNDIENPEDWLSEATQHRGSWWPLWQNWLSKRSGKQIKAPAKSGNQKYKVITPAPGTYIFE